MGTGSIGLLIIMFTVFFSYRGLKDHRFYKHFAFYVDKVLVEKEYRRLITSGFLHVNWMHLIFNMIALYAFSASIEAYLGPLNFLLLYFISLLSGNLFSLFIHRHHGAYGSVGASGAISGIIFASIALFPGIHIGFFFLPLSIPAWIYGLVYVLYSIYGIHSRRDNVGHESHLAGAVTGMLLALFMEPSAPVRNYVPIIAILVPALIFIYIIITRPQLLLIDNRFFKYQQRFHSIEDRYNTEKLDRQKQIDMILEKIHKKGMKSLTKKEREILAKYYETVR